MSRTSAAPMRWAKLTLPGALVLAVASGVLWTTWWMPRRAFLHDLQDGMRSYLMGNMEQARESLLSASTRRPKDDAARRLLAKVAVEDSLRRLRSGDRDGAVQRLTDVLMGLPPEDPATVELTRLKDRLLQRGGLRHRDIPSLLSDIKPTSVTEAIKPEWAREMETNRDFLVKTISENQRLWIAALDRERDLWRLFIIRGIALVLGVAILLTGVMALLFRKVFGRRGWMRQILEEHTQRVLSVATGGPASALPPGPGSELRKIDFIEAELVNDNDQGIARAALRSYLDMEDPWIRGRAAKAFYKLDPKAAVNCMQELLKEDSTQSQLSGIWALGEIATPPSVEALSALAWSENPEIQKAVLRVLVQLNYQQKLPTETQSKVRNLLTELREKTPWII